MTRNTWLMALTAVLSLYAALHGCQGEQAIRTAQYAVNGHKLYVAQCQNCHGAKGEGLGTLYPPLTDSTFLAANRQRLACIVKHGTSGLMEVGGKHFDTEMPPNPQLAPVEIAYLLTYIGNSFGNDMGLFTQEEIQESLAGCMD